MKWLLGLVLIAAAATIGCASGQNDTGDKDPIVFSGVLRVVGSANEATLILDLVTTPRLEKEHAARLGIAAGDFPLRALAVVGTAHDELWKHQGQKISAIGGIVSLAEWRKKDSQPQVRLVSPNLKYCIDIKSWNLADN